MQNLFMFKIVIAACTYFFERRIKTFKKQLIAAFIIRWLDKMISRFRIKSSYKSTFQTLYCMFKIKQEQPFS